MKFDTTKLDRRDIYKLLVGTVLPRPIAFVTSLGEDGTINAAPFSFFNAMGSAPPVIALGLEPRDGHNKDTAANILERREFVVNIVDEALSVQMNIAAGNYPPEVSEVDEAGLETLPSIAVSPPRLAAAPASFECKLYDSLALPGGGHIIIGEVLHFHYRDDVVASTDPIRIDIDKLAPISRLSGSLYGRTTEQFELKRPK